MQRRAHSSHNAATNNIRYLTHHIWQERLALLLGQPHSFWNNWSNDWFTKKCTLYEVFISEIYDTTIVSRDIDHTRFYYWMQPHSEVSRSRDGRCMKKAHPHFISDESDKRFSIYRQTIFPNSPILKQLVKWSMHEKGSSKVSGASFSYRKLRFSLLKIVIYDFSVSRSWAVRKYLRKSRKIYADLRGHRKFTNDVFGPMLHGNVG